MLGTLPRVVPVVLAPSEMRYVHSPDVWWVGEGTGTVAAGEFPKVPHRVFFFLGKILLQDPVGPSVQEGTGLSHSPPLQVGPWLSGAGSHVAQLSTLLGHRLWSSWFSASSLFPSLRPQTTRSLTVLLRPCLTAEPAVNQAFSQESCGRPR